MSNDSYRDIDEHFAHFLATTHKNNEAAATLTLAYVMSRMTGFDVCLSGTTESNEIRLTIDNDIEKRFKVSTRAEPEPSQPLPTITPGRSVRIGSKANG